MAELKTVGVAGCGTMGAGIAIVCARAGFTTIVYDTREQALTRAREQSEAFFRKSVERGKLKAEELPTILARWSSTTSLAVTRASAARCRQRKALRPVVNSSLTVR